MHLQRDWQWQQMRGRAGQEGAEAGAAGLHVIQFFCTGSDLKRTRSRVSAGSGSGSVDRCAIQQRSIYFAPALYALFFVAHKTQYPDLMSFVMHPLLAAAAAATR